MPIKPAFLALSLHNLGSGSTLVLVDGRRVAQSGVGNRNSATGQGFVDLNTIPLGLIERVEIITDGASAIYGADAVAGVINIILRKNWSGSELSASSRGAAHGGGTEWQGTLTTGFTSGKLRGTLALDYYKREPLFASQRSFSNGMDNRGIYLGETTFGPAYGLDYRMQFGYAPTVQVVPFSAASFANLPGVRVALAPEGASSMPTLAAFIPRTSNASNQNSSLTTVIGQGQRATSVSDFLNLVPEAERYGVTGNFTYDAGGGAEIYGSISHTDSRSFAQTLPAYIGTPNNAFTAAYIVPAA
ncbi:MAG: TonB-dependent receptor plug domain-containing protein, partial [Opitutaceae bacterium]|nr:TonB-dependent receptor plug domain-containing protein [Opitutaceae bacterium]